MANWFIAIFQSCAARPQSAVMLRSASQIRLLAARAAAVRRRPRSLGLPFSLWTLQRLVDYLAEQTGIRIALETLRQVLKGEGIVLSRPQHKISSPDPEYQVKKKSGRRHPRPPETG
jgi:transposase